MAGIGESCSHVASLLWAVESGVRIRDSMTVTQKQAYWVIPNAVKEVPYAPVQNINFQGKKGSHMKRTAARSSQSPTSDLEKVPSDEEMTTFFTSLASCSSKPAILALVEPHS